MVAQMLAHIMHKFSLDQIAVSGVLDAPGDFFAEIGSLGPTERPALLGVVCLAVAITGKAKAADKLFYAHCLEEVNAAPPPRQSPTLTAVGSQLLMFGGRQGDVHFLNDTWLFDPAAASWRCVRESDTLPMLPGLAWVHYQNPPRPSPRWAHSAVAFDRAVLLFGGSAPGMCFNDLHFFDSTTLQWREHVVTDGPKPAARSGHCACAVGDRMFVFGGNTTQCSFNDLWTFSTSRAVWTHVRAGGAPLGRVGHTLTLLGSWLLLLGGRDYSTNRFDPCLHAFDVR